VAFVADTSEASDCDGVTLSFAFLGALARRLGLST
jgi:hypothetical protein